MSGYVWYSFGSDQTGPALGKALKFDSGKKTPCLDNYEVVVGWGCKPGKKYVSEVWSQRIAQGQLRILNHPDAVQRNRNKLDALNRLKDAGLETPGFHDLVTAESVTQQRQQIARAVEQGVLQFPVIGLNDFHKGEPAFCYTIEDVGIALRRKTEAPIRYFRTFDHGDEYRIHVFRDTLLLAQKKGLAEHPNDAAAKSLLKKLKKRRGKDGKALSEKDEAFAREVIDCLASEIIQNSSHLKKSTSLGWQHHLENLSTVPKAILNLAVEALDALQLDMGAVSISWANKDARVLSATTAPALTDEEMKYYVAEVKTFSGASTIPEKKMPEAAKKGNKASPELIAKIQRKIKATSVEKAEEVLKSLEE
jgi:hypothetical protein